MVRRLVLFFKANDWVLTLSILLLLLVGLSALYGSGKNSDEGYQSFLRQGIFAILGVVVYIFFASIDFRRLRSFGGVFYVIALILLTAVLLFGTTIRNTTGWFRIGSFGLQPIEIVKVLWILAMAAFLVFRGQRMNEWKNIGTLGALMFGIVFLTMLQPDLGSALVVIGTTLILMLITNIKITKILLVGLLIILVSASGWFWFLRDYQKERIQVLFDPSLDPLGRGYHVTQSIIAIGSGGWFGRGLGYGSQSQLQFLPEQQTDFIFAAYAEEWGFLGVMLLFLLFGIVIWRLLLHALRAATNFERLFAAGVAVLFMSHFFVHIGMNIGLLPVTGTTIPFLSYGGSHLLTEFIAVGMVMGMRRYVSVGRQQIDTSILEA